MKPRIKPRNPLVVPAKFRKAGSHQKPYKTQRRAERIALMKSAKNSRSTGNSTAEFQSKHLDPGCFG
jgi:hypothetical protein